MQRWIHKNILMHVHSHPASYAYKEKTSPRDAAAMHAGCKWMIKLGATNFFESILEPDVYRVFREMGYQALVAFELARICTRVRPSGNPVKTDRFKDGMGNLPCKNVAIGHEMGLKILFAKFMKSCEHMGCGQIRVKLKLSRLARERLS